MSASIPGPFGRRLRLTPMRDLLRGRVTGRLDWTGRIAASDLPEPLKGHVFTVVNRTKLWRAERSAVAGELIAHFHDGLTAGETAEALIADFGDVKTAANLIRRAKRRQRPMVWHTVRIVSWAVAGVAAVYAVSLGHFLLGRPAPAVDYVARLNAPVLNVPEADRAYFLYVKATRRLRSWPPEEWQAHERESRTLQARPGEALWPDLVRWTHAESLSIKQIRTAAAMPAYGAVLRPATSPGDSLRTPTGILSADTRPLGDAARMLAIDARVAVFENDGERFVANIAALRGVMGHYRQVPGRGFYWISQYVRQLGELVNDTLVERPGRLDVKQWVAVAHLLSDLGENPALDPTFADATFADTLQSVYTDDGAGDGRPTFAGQRLLRRQTPASSDPNYAGSWIARGLADYGPVAIAGARTWLDSRADVRREYEAFRAAGLAELRKPLREADWTAWHERVQNRADGPVGTSARFWTDLPASPHVHQYWEALLARRDGVTVGIALELFRRAHGRYPTRLEELTPRFLPAVPADAADGLPVRYRLVDGRPLVYSIGGDGRDDGGYSPPLQANSDAYATAPRPQAAPIARYSGDFVLYPRPADPPPPAND